MLAIFPLNGGKVSWNVTKKQMWDVAEYISAGGERKTLIHQSLPRWSISLKFPCLSQTEVNNIMGFYAKCKGAWKPFFYKDYEDYEVIGKVLPVNSDGSYQAVIPIGGYEEPAELVDNVRVWVDGRRTKDFTVSGGKITVNSDGKIVKFDYEYYLKVAFENNITVTQLFYNAYSMSFKLEVVR